MLLSDKRREGSIGESQAVRVRSRLAPTPSGYLHLGNAFNFILTWWLARYFRGTLRLRIDDVDAARVRQEYIDDIFYVLEWLGLEWDEGPFSTQEHLKKYSLQLNLPRYEYILKSLKQAGTIYACTCSRAQIARGIQCLCAMRYNDRTPEVPFAWKMNTASVKITIQDGWQDALVVDLQAQIPHFVVWRADGLPAYQLFSVAEDAAHGITHIVRGNDLIPSTAAQLYLAEKAGMSSFAKVNFYHHPLLRASDGKKLSKSLGSMALKTIRHSQKDPVWVYRKLAEWISVDYPIQKANDLLHINPVNLQFKTS
ncbi:MAG: glutamate--tRNA ligase family protein [Chitinophagales bacterium]|nr:glutamate--tRNA ligase family protein [Chitinophagales bacterium]MDW8419338.1 glutamate--tRNA ligase family protein [Chitinophagales bacterium]